MVVIRKIQLQTVIIKLPYPIISATLADPSQTVMTLKDETGHFSATRLALHIPLMAPQPSCDFMVPATPVFMIARWFHCLVEHIAEMPALHCLKPIIDSLVVPGPKATLMPEWTAAALPDLAAYITKSLAAARALISIFNIERRSIHQVTHRQVMWLQPWYSSTIARQL